MSDIARRVLVTCGTSTNGAAIVELLRGGGLDVVFTGPNERLGESIAQQADATFIRSDGCEFEDVSCSVHSTIETLGGLDALVFTTDAWESGLLTRTSDDVWDDLLSSNVIAAVYYVRECLPVLRASGGGEIVIVVSDVALDPDATTGAYAVMQRALLAMSMMLELESTAGNVRVTVVLSENAAEGMRAAGSSASGDDKKEVSLSVPGHSSQATEVAESVMFCLSERRRSSRTRVCTHSSRTFDVAVRTARRVEAVGDR